jgi:hypothetical protein
VLLVGGESELLAVFGELEVRFSLQRSGVRAITLNATTATAYERRNALGVGALLLDGIGRVLHIQLRLLRLVASRTCCDMSPQAQGSALQPAGASRTMYTSSSLQPSNVAAQDWSSSECSCLSISRAQYSLSILETHLRIQATRFSGGAQDGRDLLAITQRGDG